MKERAEEHQCSQPEQNVLHNKYTNMKMMFSFTVFKLKRHVRAAILDSLLGYNCKGRQAGRQAGEIFAEETKHQA